MTVILAGLADDVDLDTLDRQLGELHPKNDSFPGEVFLDLAVDALDVGGFTRADPLDYDDLWTRLLPEVRLRGRHDHHKAQYALMSPAALRGGLNPDLERELYWWNGDDYWQFAFFALIIYTRAAAEQTGTSVVEIAQRIAQMHSLNLSSA